VLEAGVQVGLSFDRFDVIHVRVVDVRVDAKESLEHLLDVFDEIFGKFVSFLLREDVRVFEFGRQPIFHKCLSSNCPQARSKKSKF